MSPGQQRAAAAYLGERYEVSQRRASRVMHQGQRTLKC
jgi:hypothetical protein